MSLVGLFELLQQKPAFQQLADRIKQFGTVPNVGLIESAKPFLIASLWHHLKVPVLVISPRPEDARRTYSQLLTYLPEESPIHILPETDILAFERLAADDATNNQRLQAIWSLFPESDSTSPPLVLASIGSVLRKTLSPDTMREYAFHLAVGQSLSLGDMFSQWIRLGYRREEGVEVPGTFANRGNIVDVFSPHSTLPMRIDFWGNQVDSIRLFDPQTQRSIREVDRITVIPAQEILSSVTEQESFSRIKSDLNFTNCIQSVSERINEELASMISNHHVETPSFYNGFFNSCCLLDHLPVESLIVLDRYPELEEEVAKQEDHITRLRLSREVRGELPTNFPSPRISWSQFVETSETLRRLVVRSWPSETDELGFKPAPPHNGRLDDVISNVSTMIKQGNTVIIVSPHANRLSELLQNEDIGSIELTDLTSIPHAGSITLIHSALREGWSIPMENEQIVLMTDAEIFGSFKERRITRKTPIRTESYVSELVPGSYVVHIDHGIARLAGTTQIGSNGDQKEYLVLEYADEDKLYVPTEHLDRVTPYTASSDHTPNPTRLGTQEWARAKQRVKTSTLELAQELLTIYASRQIANGHRFSPDSPWQRQLEDTFPFQETIDQSRTIDEVKSDMEQPRPMDRLVCGDVGYGKTEVALRAAFKAVMDGMQASVLVPTTVLAQQHYATFSERLSPFPIKVDLLSRFRTHKEQKKVVDALHAGTIDMVIGTHRLLQKDVGFKNLGLVIVDEEHRFGVVHKERLKQMSKEIDILTLSATPIPRTLYMGLSGIRDMSTMETPPEERFPIATYVSEYSDDLVREAILRELERGGQVFFLHNRVRSIKRMAANIQKLVPQASVAIGHGQMLESDLEDVLLQFAQEKVDVLVCTTIIESGLDIPNANTLIIDRSDRFGLSQLYQLRGRVGRASQRAYAYLLIPHGRRITDAAEKRLNAILEATELGGGFKIAMRDLEIRGTGNMLGAEQSGHIHSIGFELYSRLLNEAVTELKAKQEGILPNTNTLPFEVRVDLPISAYIPHEYIDHLPTRLAIYQRLTRIHDRDEVRSMEKELRDRFGPVPESTMNLLYVIELKVLAAIATVESLSSKGPQITISLANSVGGAAPALEKTLGHKVKVGNRQIRINMQTLDDPKTKSELISIFERLISFSQRIEAAMTH